MAAKSTKAEISRRVEFVLRLRIQGAEVWEIREIVQKDGEPWPDGHGTAWGVTDNTLYRYMQLADELLAKTTERDRVKNLNRHLAYRRMLFGRAVQASDIRAALAVAADEAKLLDLYPKTAPPSRLTDDEIAAELANALGPPASGEGSPSTSGAGSEEEAADGEDSSD